MKKIFLFLASVLLTSTALAAPTVAVMVEPKASRQITKIEPKLVLKNLIKSYLTFNQNSAELTLTLNIPCAKGRICPRVARVQELKYNLAITEVRHNECDVTYTAETLATTFPSAKITIIDRELSQCMTTMEKPYRAGEVILTLKNYDSKKDVVVEGQLTFQVQRFVRALHQ